MKKKNTGRWIIAAVAVVLIVGAYYYFAVYRREVCGAVV